MDGTMVRQEKQTALSRRSKTSYTPAQTRILLALGEALLLRGAEPNETYLDAMTLRLSKESDTELVVRALESLRDSERGQGETALLSPGRVLREMRTVSEPNHPHAHLRMLVRKMAKAFRVDADEELLQAFADVAGHRTDGDQDRAYAALMRNGEHKFMPSPGAFLSACGLMTERRDGGKVE